MVPKITLREELGQRILPVYMNEHKSIISSTKSPSENYDRSKVACTELIIILSILQMRVKALDQHMKKRNKTIRSILPLSMSEHKIVDEEYIRELRSFGNGYYRTENSIQLLAAASEGTRLLHESCTDVASATKPGNRL